MGHLIGPLPLPLGGDVAGTTTSGSTLAGVDHVASALSRLIEQFKGKPNFEASISAQAEPCQTVEAALQQLSMLPSVENAFGAQLDNLGAIVGEERQGATDGDYRLHIKARIAANRSSGTPEDLYTVFALIAPVGATYRIEECPPAALIFHILTVQTSPALADYLLQFLARVKAAGVRAQLHWLNAPGTGSFCFAGGPGLGFDGGIWSTSE
jgi:hypothetical protein